MTFSGQTTARSRWRAKSFKPDYLPARRCHGCDRERAHEVGGERRLRKVFITYACNVGTVSITVNPADISTSRTVSGNPAGGTVTLLTNPRPMLLRLGACQRYRWEWSYMGRTDPQPSGTPSSIQATCRRPGTWPEM